MRGLLVIKTINIASSVGNELNYHISYIPIACMAKYFFSRNLSHESLFVSLTNLLK